ncbi:hypothetical protein L7F22_065734 [Adiantum nelumboides]|nr:hypothetical protein [Adiantum nelumboides]
MQRGPSEHPLTSRIIIRLVLEHAGKPYDLSVSFNTSRLTIRLANECSKDPRCVFSSLHCVKLQRGPSEHSSARRITIRLALELADKPYDLPISSNANRLTIRFADGCSKDPRCVFNALDCNADLLSTHRQNSRITIRLASELADKPYDLPASSNASRLTIQLANGCSEGQRCVFSALNCVKLQRGPCEHPSTNRITIRFVLEFADKSYDLSASSNANWLTIRFVDGCSKRPRYVFCALDCVKLHRGPSEHPSASRIIIRLALELVDKSYDLPANFNAIRITKPLADGCSEDPHCVFSALDYVKLQRGSFEHTSVSRIIIRLALELAGKPYDLPVSSNASRITIRLADGCSKASSNASRLTIRLVDGCSKSSRCVFSALDYVKLQHGPSEHPSANRITIRLALELADKPYDLSASSNTKPLTIRLVNGCSEGPRCIFSVLNCVKLQCGPSEHPSASRITIWLALEFAGKPYDLLVSSNASRITKRLADGCSESPRCVFSALDCVKLQRGPSKHPSASRITIWLALELVGKPYDLPMLLLLHNICICRGESFDMEWVREAELELTRSCLAEEARSSATSSILELHATRQMETKDAMERAQRDKDSVVDLGSSSERCNNLAKATYQEQTRVNLVKIFGDEALADMDSSSSSFA